MSNFDPVWASGGQAQIAEPSASQKETGFECGPADNRIFNWLFNKITENVNLNADNIQALIEALANALTAVASDGSITGIGTESDPLKVNGKNGKGLTVTVTPDGIRWDLTYEAPALTEDVSNTYHMLLSAVNGGDANGNKELNSAVNADARYVISHFLNEVLGFQSWFNAALTAPVDTTRPWFDNSADAMRWKQWDMTNSNWVSSDMNQIAERLYADRASGLVSFTASINAPLDKTQPWIDLSDDPCVVKIWNGAIWTVIDSGDLNRLYVYGANFPPSLTTDLGGIIPAGPDPRMWINDITERLFVWADGLSKYLQFEIYTPVSAMPEIGAGSPLTDQNGILGTPITAYTTPVDLFADDGGVGNLTLTAINVPTGIVFTDNGDGTGTFTGTPTGNSVNMTTTITATDSDNQSVSDSTLDWSIISEAPTLGAGAPFADQNGSIGVSIGTIVTPVDLFADDGGVGNLTLTATNLPAGIVFTDNGNGTGTFFGTPSGPVGVTSTTITATDEDDQSVSDVIDWTIASAPPTVGTGSPLTDQIVNIATPITAYTTPVNLFADDDGVENLTLTAINVPTGIVFTDNSNGTGTFTGTPTGPVGAVTTTITATDSDGQYVDDSTLDWTVNAALSAPPTVGAGSPLTDFEVEIGVAITSYTTPVDLFADDGGVGNLTLTATNLPAGIVFTDNGDGTGTLTGTPTGPVGDVTVTITATDGDNQSVSDSTLDITVNPAIITAPAQEFVYTGECVDYVVPANVTHVDAEVAAGGAGSGTYSQPSTAANGGFVSARFPVTPGEILKICVGGGGLGGSRGGASGYSGIFRGTISPSNAIMIAGGAGSNGMGTSYGGIGGHGGDGGGLIGEDGQVGTPAAGQTAFEPGQGGTQSTGGLAGTDSATGTPTNGDALLGGDSNQPENGNPGSLFGGGHSGSGADGGAGGGGWFGGGGGAGGSTNLHCGGGGGGGSSFTDGSCESVDHLQGGGGQGGTNGTVGANGWINFV